MGIQDQLVLDKDSICEVIANTLSLSLMDVNSDLSYQSVSEWDSLGHVSLMLALEKKFHVKIDQDKILDLTSVDAIIAYILDAVGSKTSPITPVKTDQSVHIYRGLNNIYFDESQIAFLDAQNSRLFYRGYSITDLVEQASYEQVAYLLMCGQLPSAEQLSSFEQKLKSFRELPAEILGLVEVLSKTQSLIDVLRTAVSALPSTVEHLSDQEQGIAYIAKIPSIIGAYYAYKNNESMPVSTEKLSHAEYLLLMMLGKLPDSTTVRAFEQNLILQAEHDANASTFTARVAKSTESSLGAAITAAIATFSGALHGGALLAVVKMLEEISTVDNAKVYVQNRIKNKKPVYGFGHRVYRVEDPRAEPLRKNAELLSKQCQNTVWLDILEAVKGEMKDYIEHGININVDFYACVSYNLMGLRDEMMVPTFIAARSAGWVAHVFEQADNNILIRPRLKYVGPLDKKLL